MPGRDATVLTAELCKERFWNTAGQEGLARPGSMYHPAA